MSEPTSPIPQAGTFRLQDLPGRAGKSIRVPPGRLGIVIHPDSRAETFPEGEHTVLTPWQRLSGKGAGLQSGYLPTGELLVHLTMEYLLSGDGVLLDCSLVCAAQVSDPVIFFREIVIPRGELRAATLEIDAQLYKNTLGALASQYAASDLVSGRLNNRLLENVEAGLAAILQPQGLRFVEARLLALSRSENRAVIAEKAQALRERLQDVELQRRMADVENQAQLDEFLQQVAPGVESVLAVEASEAGHTAAAQPGKIGASLQGWLEAASGQLGRAKPHLTRLLQRQQKEQSPTGPAPIPRTPRRAKKWWLPRARWIVAILLLGVLLTYIFNRIAEWAEWESTTEIMIIIWGFVITVVLESLKSLFDKWEEVSEENWIKFGFQHLDDLVGGDRAKADVVVREQCARELRHIKEVISDIRSQEYRRGNIDLALALKNSIENNLEDTLEKVMRGEYGQPPYVTDLRISQRAWENMLDNDEDLLLYINALGEKAGWLQQKSHQGELTPEMVTDMNVGISTFGARFFERGRSLQVPGAQPVRK